MTDGELLLATVDQLDGYRVESYHGVISVHVSCGINFVRGWFVALRDLVGGKVGTFENEAVRLEERAKRELCERPRQILHDLATRPARRQRCIGSACRGV